MKPFLDALAEAAARLPKQTKGAEESARAYEKQVAKILEQWDALAHKIGEITLPWVSNLLTDLDSAIEKGKTLAETLGGKGTAFEKLKAVEDTTGSPLMGKAASSAIGWLKELFGIKEAGAAEAKPGQGRPVAGRIARAQV